MCRESLIAGVGLDPSVMNTNDDRTFLALDCEEWAIREKAFTGLFNETSQPSDRTEEK